MGWERRTRGGLYYTRSKKVRGRVVRNTSAVGCLAALSNAERRSQLKAQAQAWRAERAYLGRRMLRYTCCLIHPRQWRAAA